MCERLEMPGVLPQKVAPPSDLQLKCRHVVQLRYVCGVFQHFARPHQWARFYGGCGFPGLAGHRRFFRRGIFRFFRRSGGVESPRFRYWHVRKRLIVSGVQPVKSSPCAAQRGNCYDPKRCPAAHAFCVTLPRIKSWCVPLPSYNIFSLEEIIRPRRPARREPSAYQNASRSSFRARGGGNQPFAKWIVGRSAAADLGGFPECATS